MIDKNKLQRSMEFRKAMQMFAATLADNEEAMIAIPSVFPAWAVGVAYKIKDVVSYGTNSVGDIQLYQVLQDHTSTEQWTPDSANSLYKKVGVTSSGYPLWVQPLGATDAYNIGDIVSYKDKLYKSIINANVWAPDVYPAGWEVVVIQVKQVVAIAAQPNQKPHRPKQSQILYSQQEHMTHIRRAIKSSLKARSIRA